MNMAGVVSDLDYDPDPVNLVCSRKMRELFDLLIGMADALFFIKGLSPDGESVLCICVTHCLCPAEQDFTMKSYFFHDSVGRRPDKQRDVHFNFT